MKKIICFSLLSSIVIFYSLSALADGNLNKKYIGLSKTNEGVTVGDIPFQYASVSNVIEKISYDGVQGKVGTIYGALKEEGKFGNSRKFDGVDDYVAAELVPEVTYTGVYTMEAWVKVNNGRHTILQNSPDGNNRNGLTISGTTASFGYYPGSSWISKSGTIEIEKWVHLAGVNQAGTLKFYINGEEQNGTSGTYVSVTNQLIMGKVNIDNRAMLNGNIDEVRIWKTARTQQQIKEYMNKPLKGNEEGLVRYYPFD